VRSSLEAALSVALYPSVCLSVPFVQFSRNRRAAETSNFDLRHTKTKMMHPTSTLFTVLLVHLILRISPHLSHHLRSHHLPLPRPFIPDLRLISFTNPFLRSHSYSFLTPFTDFEPVLKYHVKLSYRMVHGRFCTRR